jgi:hypothetical protein
MTDPMGLAILGIIIGTLAAIVYSLRILVLLERRVARMDAHVEVIVKRIAKEEVRIEKAEDSILKTEKEILNKLSNKKPKKK